MDIKTLESFKLSDAISFHDELNRNLWDMNNKLRPEVKKQLLIIARDFIDELGIRDLDVEDITVSGSNAAYSYTPHSDLDLHILVDLSKMDNNEIYKELFHAKKTIYNDSHNIKIHGVPVELYVQDSREPVVSLGEYSILDDDWIKIPTKRRANLDQTATKQKYENLLALVKKTLKSKDIKLVEKVLKKIKQYRQAGLDKGGEFGPENLAFKILRSQGYIGKLYELREKLHSEVLTIENKSNLTDKITLNQLYHGNFPDRDEMFWDYVRPNELDIPLEIKTLGKHKLQIMLLSQYRIEHLDELFDMMDDNQVNVVKKYIKDPTLPNKIIVISNDRIIDGNHRALAAAKKGTSINYIDLADLEDELNEDETMQFASEKTPVISPYAGIKDNQFRGGISEASGYIPSEKEKNDPRFKTALTVDVKPYTMKKDAKKFGNKISRAGIPPTARPDGKF